MAVNPLTTKGSPTIIWLCILHGDSLNGTIATILFTIAKVTTMGHFESRQPSSESTPSEQRFADSSTALLHGHPAERPCTRVPSPSEAVWQKIVLGDHHQHFFKVVIIKTGPLTVDVLVTRNPQHSSCTICNLRKLDPLGDQSLKDMRLQDRRLGVPKAH